jgi:hypothetical protein
VAQLIGPTCPAHLSRGLLVRILAYRVQAQACGDLDRYTARALDRWNEPNGRERTYGQAPGAPDESAENSSAPKRRASEPLILKPGTLLTREWQGRMETVPSVPMMLRQSPAGSLPLRAEVETSHGYASYH